VDDVVADRFGSSTPRRPSADGVEGGGVFEVVDRFRPSSVTAVHGDALAECRFAFDSGTSRSRRCRSRVLP
jgi:hypothetical protein